MVPKFRAYDTKNKVMVTNFHRSHMKIETGKVLYQLTTTNENEIKAIASYNTFDDYIYRYSHDLELMQSTGLKDKNGVEIYERDIVVNQYGNVGYVAYLQQEAGFVVVLKKSDYRLGHRNTGESYDVTTNHEVIGNIHSNPELLEPANEN